jgi:hypothetical protein
LKVRHSVRPGRNSLICGRRLWTKEMQKRRACCDSDVSGGQRGIRSCGPAPSAHEDMGFFRRRGASEDADRISTTAVVLHATTPPEGGTTLGPGSHEDIRIVADPGSGKRTLHGKLRLTEEHWLVPGMEIPVRFARNKPERFEIDRDLIPSMEARAAAK